MSSELVPSVSVENVISQRNAMIERLRKAAEIFGEIEVLAGSAFPDASYNYGRHSLQCRHLNARFPEDLEDFEKAVDATAWDHLLHASGMRTFMDAEGRKKWDEAVSSRKVPELTEENIRATFADLYANRGTMFEDGVVQVFRKLSWDYKTNNPRMFGRRIIIKYLVDVWGTGGRKYITGACYEKCNMLDDLIRVLHVLDGKQEPDHRQGAMNLLREVKWPMETQVANLHGLLSVKGFKNGNGHVTFLRSDLIDKMNRILAGRYPNALPPAED